MSNLLLKTRVKNSTSLKNLVIALFAGLMLVCSSANVSAHTFRIAPDTVTCYTNLDLKVFVTISGAGIAYGGSIALQLPPNWGKPQDTLFNLQSGAQNPLSIKCTTNNSINFNIITDDWLHPLSGIYTNEVHVCRFIVTSVVGLVSGDILEIDFGNQFPGGNMGGGGWGYSPSRLASLEHFYFQTQHDSLSVLSPVDSLPILQQPQAVYRIVALAKSNPDINTQFELRVVAFDKLNNPANYTRTIHFSNYDGTINLPPDYTFTASDSGAHSFYIAITDFDLHRIQVSDNGGITCLSNPLIVDTSGLKVFWGDLHTHSQLSHHGLAYPPAVFHYGKYISFLDYLAFTEHSYIPDSQYRAGIVLGNQYNSDGNFVTFNGYEWSTALYGHKCVFFKDSNPPAIVTNYNNPDFLLTSVRASGGLVLVSHSTGLWGLPASLYTNWDYFDPAVQTNAEVTGNSGICFEKIDTAHAATRTSVPGTSIQDGLARHYIFGLVGASDNHQGRPGKNPNPESNAALTYVYQNLVSKDVGISASYSPVLTRNAIFSSLASRHNYGTTGARMLLKFNIGSYMMGDYFTWDSLAGFPIIKSVIHGTDTISKVELVRNNDVLLTYTPNTLDYTFQYTDNSATFNSFYYVRVTQTTGDMAWSSPIWLLDSSTFTTNQQYLQIKFDVDIFPNPNNGQFEIKFFNNFSKSCLITLTDVTGKTVYNNQINNLSPFANTTLPISISGLSQGMYFLNVNCDNYIVHKKLVIEQPKK